MLKVFNFLNKLIYLITNKKKKKKKRRETDR
jgi:hypothetical protein